MSWISATSVSIAGVGNARLAAERRDDADLRIDLGLALAHGEIAPDAGMGFRGRGWCTRRASRSIARCARRSLARRRRRPPGRNRLKPTGVTPRALATAMTSRPSVIEHRRSAAGRRNCRPSSRSSARWRTASRHRRACPTGSPRCCRSAPHRARTSAAARASRACVRGSLPSISPTTTAPRLPNRIVPGRASRRRS